MTETGDHKKPMSNSGTDSKTRAGDAGDPCEETRASAGLPRVEPETFTDGQNASADQGVTDQRVTEQQAPEHHRTAEQRAAEQRPVEHQAANHRAMEHRPAEQRVTEPPSSAPKSADAAPENAGATRSLDAADTGAASRTHSSAGESSTANSEASSADNASTPAAGSIDTQDLHDRIVDQMKTVYDPEIPVDIYELGMIYEIDVESDGRAHVTMTLTSPACPVAGTLPGEVEEKLNEVDGVKDGKVELVWDPPWSPDLMSESAKLELGMM